MPCYDGRNDEPRRSESDIREIEKLNSQVKLLLQRSSQLEASLCALLTELENDGSINDILHQAVINGEIGFLEKFWAEHKNKDEQRIRKELEKFSPHELNLIKKLLS